jgi:pyruvate/2-oxoglutarate dehydrogenase complex dihydrolipoamide acyltransferase (E2) component
VSADASSGELVEVLVPDIGDVADVPVIEILVEPGQEVAVEDPLITLESDKATMEVPSPREGVVRELRLGVGDTVSEGTLILILEAAATPDGAGPPEVSEPAADAPAAP